MPRKLFSSRTLFWVSACAVLAVLLCSGFYLTGSILVGVALIGAILGLFFPELDDEASWGIAWVGGWAAGAAWLSHLAPWGWKGTLGFAAVALMAALRTIRHLLDRPQKGFKLYSFSSRKLKWALAYTALIELIALAAGGNRGDLYALPVAGVMLGFTASGSKYRFALLGGLATALSALWLVDLIDGSSGGVKFFFAAVFGIIGALVTRPSKPVHGNRELQAPETGAVLVP